jgi:hypothetical protein
LLRLKLLSKSLRLSHQLHHVLLVVARHLPELLLEISLVWGTTADTKHLNVYL